MSPGRFNVITQDNRNKWDNVTQSRDLFEFRDVKTENASSIKNKVENS